MACVRAEGLLVVSVPVVGAVAILLTPWLTPYIMVYDWSILLVPAVLLWRHASTTAQQRDCWLVLMAVIWLAALLVAFSLLLTQVRLGRANIKVAKQKGTHRKPRRPGNAH